MNRKTEITSAVKTTINKVVYRALTNLLKDRIGGIEYHGYCWIAQDDLDEVYQMFSAAPKIENFSEKDEELVRQFGEGPVGIAHVRVFATLRDHKDNYLEVSGVLALGAFGNDTGAYVIGGTAEEDPLNIKLAFSRLPLLKDMAASITEDLCLLFQVPAQYGNVFVRLGIKGDTYQERTVSRGGAELNIRAALRAKKTEPKQAKSSKSELRCDGCEKKAEPDLEATETLRATGMLKNEDPVPSLNLVIINDEVLQLCSECSKLAQDSAI